MLRPGGQVRPATYKAKIDATSLTLSSFPSGQEVELGNEITILLDDNHPAQEGSAVAPKSVHTRR